VAELNDFTKQTIGLDRDELRVALLSWLEHDAEGLGHPIAFSTAASVEPVLLLEVDMHPGPTPGTCTGWERLSLREAVHLQRSTSSQPTALVWESPIGGWERVSTERERWSGYPKMGASLRLFASEFSSAYNVANADPPSTLRCPNGHEYEAVTAHRFCPVCGEPLK